MSKLRCVEVGEGCNSFFTLNKEYRTQCERTHVFINDNDGAPWLIGMDGLTIIEPVFSSQQLVARFEVVG